MFSASMIALDTWIQGHPIWRLWSNWTSTHWSEALISTMILQGLSLGILPCIHHLRSPWLLVSKAIMLAVSLCSIFNPSACWKGLLIPRETPLGASFIFNGQFRNPFMSLLKSPAILGSPETLFLVVRLLRTFFCKVWSTPMNEEKGPWKYSKVLKCFH